MMKYSRIFGSMVLLAVGASATPASADIATNASGTVNQVEYTANLLMLQLPNGNNYVGSTTAPGCNSSYAASLDSLKMWLSIGQSALLSGRTIKIYYNWCTATSTRYVYDVVLQATP